jgi:phospholipid/cholesterol/gamma-HCH transport system substrate-binding protein
VGGGAAMITRRTKIQLVVFVVITLVLVTFVGARYARLDRFVMDTGYQVTAHYKESGGIFTGAEVTYRGVTIGEVSGMELTDEGVDVDLEIDNEYDDIPADARALVGNRSAVGEQYVELQPQSNGEPYLKDGSEIEQSDTATPISTTELLSNTTDLVNSVPKRSLRTVISELGDAFKGTGPDLGRLIDSSSSFIETADQNFELTSRLVSDSNVVLQTQMDKSSAIRSFARDLRLFSDTMVDADGSLRKVIEDGSATARTLRAFLEENEVDLGKLLDNLVVTGEQQVRHLDGIQMALIVYPYAVAGAYIVPSRTDGGPINAHFGLIIQQDPPVCKGGYQQERRDPESNRGNAPMNTKVRCAEPAAQSNPRGAQHSPGRAMPMAGQPGVDGKIIGEYDAGTGEMTFADDPRAVQYTGGAAESFGEHSWKWLLMQPVMQ